MVPSKTQKFDRLLAAGTPATQAALVNPSFETGDYTGWVLTETPVNPTYGIWANVASGSLITVSTPLFDFNDGISTTSGSPGLPHTFLATDGNRLALQLQNGPQFHSMTQNFTVGALDSTLSWDMYFRNSTGFNLSNQYLAVRIRDLSNSIISTLYVTNPGDPTTNGSMSSYSADISAFQGQTVRLSVDMQVDVSFFDAAFDNFQVSPVPEPTTTGLVGLAIAGIGLIRRRKN